MKDTVTVIVPVYNTNIGYLRECFRSIKNQSYQNIDVLIIDDGSDKKIADFCDAFWASAHIQARVIHNQNHGISYTRNFALDCASGDYIAFVDSDDFVTNDYIAVLLNVMKITKSRVSLCGFVRDKQELTDSDKSSQIKRMSVRKLWKSLDGIYLWRTLYDAEILRGIRFNENLSCCEDAYFFNNVIQQVGQVGYIDKKMYYYRKTPNSITRNLSSVVIEDTMSAMETLYLNNSEIKEDKTVYSRYFTNYAKVLIKYLLSAFYQEDQKSIKQSKEYVRRTIDGKMSFIQSIPIRMVLLIVRLPLSLYIPIMKIMVFFFKKFQMFRGK